MSCADTAIVLGCVFIIVLFMSTMWFHVLSFVLSCRRLCCILTVFVLVLAGTVTGIVLIWDHAQRGYALCVALAGSFVFDLLSLALVARQQKRTPCVFQQYPAIFSFEMA